MSFSCDINNKNFSSLFPANGNKKTFSSPDSMRYTPGEPNISPPYLRIAESMKRSACSFDDNSPSVVSPTPVFPPFERQSPILHPTLVHRPPSTGIARQQREPSIEEQIFGYSKQDKELIAKIEKETKINNRIYKENFSTFFCGVVISELFSNGESNPNKIYFRGGCYVRFEKTKKPKDRKDFVKTVILRANLVAEVTVFTEVQKPKSEYHYIHFANPDTYIAITKYDDSIDGKNPPQSPRK